MNLFWGKTHRKIRSLARSQLRTRSSLKNFPKGQKMGVSAIARIEKSLF